jgi:hypothetical protein
MNTTQLFSVGTFAWQHTVYSVEEDSQTLKCICVTTVAMKKQLSIKYYKCVFVTLVTQHAIHMRHIILSSVASLLHLSFHITSQIAQFSGEKLFDIKCVFFLHKVGLKHFSFEELSEILLQIYRNLHAKYPLFLSYFTETLVFWIDFRKILKCKSSWRSIQWQPICSMQMDKHIDKYDEANGHFSQFC